MLRFFRKLRERLFVEGKVRTYFFYALGEIVLVVIGILIALQINNWNELRKAKIQEQELYLKLLENLDSDLLHIQHIDSLFKVHEDIHYNLYNTLNDNATYDPDLHYGMLRWAVEFRPTLKDNYQNRVDDLSSDEVRDALNHYFQVEETTEKVIDLFETLKADLVRPYITSNNLLTLSDVYTEERYQEVDTRNSINYEALSKQFSTPEFEQVLYELRVKTSGAFQNLRVLREASQSLRKTIQGEIKQ